MKESQTFSHRRGRLPGREAASLADFILKKEKQIRPVNIILVEDRYMRRLNRRYRGQHRATDVLAFPADPDEDLLGEIYISVDAAGRQAVEYRVTLREEIFRLVAHGLLHLCGYDHETGANATRMKKLEDKYLFGYLKK
jgi:probable rRNA maturation factor